MLAIVRDITERKRLERESGITETERKRIGDELHDDLCQFSPAGLQSKVLEEEPPRGILRSGGRPK